MKKIALAMLASAAALCAACHNQKQTPPDYDSVRAASQKSQQGLDKETQQNGSNGN